MQRNANWLYLCLLLISNYVYMYFSMVIMFRFFPKILHMQVPLPIFSWENQFLADMVLVWLQYFGTCDSEQAIPLFSQIYILVPGQWLRKFRNQRGLEIVEAELNNGNLLISFKVDSHFCIVITLGKNCVLSQW